MINKAEQKIPKLELILKECLASDNIINLSSIVVDDLSVNAAISDTHSVEVEKYINDLSMYELLCLQFANQLTINKQDDVGKTIRNKLICNINRSAFLSKDKSISYGSDKVTLDMLKADINKAIELHKSFLLKYGRRELHGKLYSIDELFYNEVKSNPTNYREYFYTSCISKGYFICKLLETYELSIISDLKGHTTSFSPFDGFNAKITNIYKPSDKVAILSAKLVENITSTNVIDEYSNNIIKAMFDLTHRKYSYAKDKNGKYKVQVDKVLIIHGDNLINGLKLGASGVMAVGNDVELSIEFHHKCKDDETGISMDISSDYPNIISYLQVDGLYKEVEVLINLKDEYKRENEYLKCQSVKLLLNSLYGIFGETKKSNKLFNPQVFIDIISIGHLVMLAQLLVLHRMGGKLIQCHTDGFKAIVPNDFSKDDYDANCIEVGVPSNLIVKYEFSFNEIAFINNNNYALYDCEGGLTIRKGKYKHLNLYSGCDINKLMYGHKETNPHFEFNHNKWYEEFKEGWNILDINHKDFNLSKLEEYLVLSNDEKFIKDVCYYTSKNNKHDYNQNVFILDNVKPEERLYNVYLNKSYYKLGNTTAWAIKNSIVKYIPPVYQDCYDYYLIKPDCKKDEAGNCKAELSLSHMFLKRLLGYGLIEKHPRVTIPPEDERYSIKRLLDMHPNININILYCNKDLGNIKNFVEYLHPNRMPSKRYQLNKIMRDGRLNDKSYIDIIQDITRKDDLLLPPSKLIKGCVYHTESGFEQYRWSDDEVKANCLTDGNFDCNYHVEDKTLLFITPKNYDLSILMRYIDSKKDIFSDITNITILDCYNNNMEGIAEYKRQWYEIYGQDVYKYRVNIEKCHCPISHIFDIDERDEVLVDYHKNKVNNYNKIYNNWIVFCRYYSKLISYDCLHNNPSSNEFINIMSDANATPSTLLSQYDVNYILCEGIINNVNNRKLNNPKLHKKGVIKGCDSILAEVLFDNNNKVKSKTLSNVKSTLNILTKRLGFKKYSYNLPHYYDIEPILRICFLNGGALNKDLIGNNTRDNILNNDMSNDFVLKIILDWISFYSDAFFNNLNVFYKGVENETIHKSFNYLVDGNNTKIPLFYINRCDISKYINMLIDVNVLQPSSVLYSCNYECEGILGKKIVAWDICDDGYIVDITSNNVDFSMGLPVAIVEHFKRKGYIEKVVNSGESKYIAYYKPEAIKAEDVVYKNVMLGYIMSIALKNENSRSKLQNDIFTAFMNIVSDPSCLAFKTCFEVITDREGNIISEYDGYFNSKCKLDKSSTLWLLFDWFYNGGGYKLVKDIPDLNNELAYIGLRNELDRNGKLLSNYTIDDLLHIKAHHNKFYYYNGLDNIVGDYNAAVKLQKQQDRLQKQQEVKLQKQQDNLTEIELLNKKIDDMLPSGCSISKVRRYEGNNHLNDLGLSAVDCEEIVKVYKSIKAAKKRLK